MDVNNILKAEELNLDKKELELSNIDDLNFDEFNVNGDSMTTDMSKDNQVSLPEKSEIDMELDGGILNFDNKIMDDLDLNIDETDVDNMESNNPNHNVKVIKINADKNTIKMINK